MSKLTGKQIIAISCTMLLVLGICLTAGCINISPSTPKIVTDLVSSNTGVSLTKGVYYTETFMVYNNGSGTAKNVVLHVNLERQGSGVIDDSKTIYIGTMKAGDRSRQTVSLDGSVLYNYNVRWNTTYDK